MRRVFVVRHLRSRAGTQAAIERFQQGRGLQATGQINPATAQALGLDPNNLEAPPPR